MKNNTLANSNVRYKDSMGYFKRWPNDAGLKWLRKITGYDNLSDNIVQISSDESGKVPSELIVYTLVYDDESNPTKANFVKNVFTLESQEQQNQEACKPDVLSEENKSLLDKIIAWVDGLKGEAEYYPDGSGKNRNATWFEEYVLKHQDKDAVEDFQDYYSGSSGFNQNTVNTKPVQPSNENQSLKGQVKEKAKSITPPDAIKEVKIYYDVTTSTGRIYTDPKTYGHTGQAYNAGDTIGQRTVTIFESGKIETKYEIIQPQSNNK
ncbi:MAG: hypothetical protein R3A43_04935 [Bacteroidia bacterium]